MVNKGPKKARGRQQPNQGFLTEPSRVRIGKILEDFRASDEQVYTFEPDLAKEERAAIHAMCRKMGMTSKSSGKGANRCLSLIKNKKKQNDNKKEESVTSLRFSEESKAVLQALFMHYPPDTGEVSEDVLRNCHKVVDNANRKQDTSFFRPSIGKDEIKKKMEMLALAMNKNPKLRKTADDRAKLPIASYMNAITSTLEAHQVVLIAGETGCGKTTQVPQYILDHMWSKAEACKVVCTQPRRISAISVAERISYERGDTVGETVGYKIRFESKGGKNSSIMFCTNGVLLKVLIDRGANASEKAKNKRDRKSVV